MMPQARSFLLLALALGSAVGFAQAPQQDKPWFGLPLPPGLGDPHTPVVPVVGIAASGARVPAGEERYEELEGPRIRQNLEKIVGFSKQSRAAGDRVWGRVTGFPAAAATVTWVAEQFKDAGLQNVEVQQYKASAPMWWSRSWEARLLGDSKFGVGSQDVVLESALPTSGSQIVLGTITAPLIYVGSPSREGLPSIDVKGKVAVQHLRPASGAYSERGRTVERAQDLMRRGAVAVLNVVEQTANMHVRDFGNCGGPCFNLGGADGAFVEAAIQKATEARTVGDVRIQLRLQTETLSGLTGHNAVGVIPARASAGTSTAPAENAENVIVNAHADGWFDAAGDNADGLAVLVAMARHFSKPENRLARTLVFVASGGHHSTGLNGPTSFVKMNAALTSKTILVLNLEHIAQFQIRPTPWRVERTEQQMNFGISNESAFLQNVATRGAERYGFNLNPTFSANVPGDLGGYGPLGVPRVQAIHSGPMYHTSGDVFETISVPGLERAARFFAFFVTEASRAPRGDVDPQKR